MGSSGQPQQRHGLLGGLFGGHRHSSAPSIQPTPPDSPSYTLPPAQHNRMSGGSFNGGKPQSQFSALDAIDPNWRETWGDDLKQMGITDDQIRDNQDFIADYIRQQQAAQNVPTPVNGIETQRNRAPPPPPPPAAPSRTRSESPQSVSSGRGRGAPPAPPPARRSAAKVEPARELTPPREPSPPRGPPPPRFAAPPPLPDAGKFANTNTIAACLFTSCSSTSFERQWTPSSASTTVECSSATSVALFQCSPSTSSTLFQCASSPSFTIFRCASSPSFTIFRCTSSASSSFLKRSSTTAYANFWWTSRSSSSTSKSGFRLPIWSACLTTTTYW